MRAFALKADVKDFAGGSFAVPPDGRTFDLGARLRSGNGTVVVDNENEAQILASIPALKELAGSERDDAVAAHSKHAAKPADKAPTKDKGGDA